MSSFDKLQRRYDAQESPGYWDPLEDDREEEDAEETEDQN